MWQLLVRHAPTVVRRAWLAMAVLAVIAAAGHVSATRHCQTGAAAGERVSVQLAGADDSLPGQTCCVHDVEIGQRATCTASGDVPVPACGAAPVAAVAGPARAGRSVPMVLTQAQLQRWRH